MYNSLSEGYIDIPKILGDRFFSVRRIHRNLGMDFFPSDASPETWGWIIFRQMYPQILGDRLFSVRCIPKYLGILLLRVII